MRENERGEGRGKARGEGRGGEGTYMSEGGVFERIED